MYGDWRTAAFLAPTLAHKHFTLLAFQVQKILSLKLLLRSELFWQVMEGIARIARYYLLSPRSLWDQWSRQIRRAVYEVACPCMVPCSTPLYGGVQVFTSVRSYPPCYSVTHPVPPNLLPLSLYSLTFWHSYLCFNWLSFCVCCVLNKKSSPTDKKYRYSYSKTIKTLMNKNLYCE